MVELVGNDLSKQQAPWLKLRDDLSLLQGPRAYDGSPTWTLYDPAVHRYYRIGWLEFECLHRWTLADADEITQSIKNETPLEVETDDVERFKTFLIDNFLLKLPGREGTKRYTMFSGTAKKSFWVWLLHNYLFLRIPLIKPDGLLKKIQPYMEIFFSRGFILSLLAGIMFAVYLVSEQWTLFSHSLVYSFTVEGILLTAMMLSLSKVVHEFGHATAASHYGCRVPRMGLALMLGMPLLWTDVTDAWRLHDRKQRLVIDAAGMLAEITLATLATLLWTELPDGALRSGVYMLASSAWIITLGINLNPFMRFDGYYLLSDALDMPNLQDRSFSLALWQLREALFGFGLPQPENIEKRRFIFMVAYAWGIWIYRLILFTGIAWVVYYFFFKLLGLFLFAVEIGWFIVRPIAKEIGVWRKLLNETGVPIRFRPSWLVPLLLLALLFIPWQTHIMVPGLYRAQSEYTLYCIEPAQVKEVFVKEGDTVEPNQVLAKLESQDLDYKITETRLTLAELTERLSSQSLELKLARNNPVDYEELQSTKAHLQGLMETKAKLTVRATFKGQVRDLSDWLKPGEYLAKDEPLGIVEDRGGTVVAYTEEADLEKLKIGGVGRFYPEGGDLPVLPVEITEVDRTGTRALKLEELASAYGGEIAVRVNDEKELVPEKGIYKITLKAKEPDPAYLGTVRGRLTLTTEPESIAQWLARISMVALVRESGW